MITEYFEAEQLAAKPIEELTGTAWAERYRILTTITSSLPGPFRSSVFKISRGILDAVTNDKVAEVSWCSGTQNGKTETLLNSIGYFMHQRPSAMMLVYPEKDDCTFMSKVRIQDMVDSARDGVLKERITKSDVRSEQFNIPFVNGYLFFAWASSANRLASKPISKIFVDEIDKFKNIISHGSPLALIRERQKAFLKSLIVMASTPTVETGAIWQAIHEAEYLFYYKVPCKECGRLINFDVSNLTSGESGVSYFCPHCGGVHDDYDKPMMIEQGEWITDDGLKLDELMNGRRSKLRLGFHSSSFHSPFISFTDIFKKCEESKKDPEKLRVFVNGWLAKPFDNSVYELEHNAEKFMNRLEDLSVLPLNCLMLTAAIDVQNDRLEVQVMGWGFEREAFVIDYKIFFGDPRNFIVWNEAQNFIIGKRYKHVCGKEFAILGTGVDTGFLTTESYAFCKRLEAMRFYALKGTGKNILTDVSRPVEKGSERVKLYTVNVSNIKDRIYHFLGVDEQGGGYIHFDKSVCDLSYFDQLTAEKKEIGLINGKRIEKWIKVRERNEALDLMIYNHAVFQILSPNLEQYANTINSTFNKIATEGKDGRDSIFSKRDSTQT